MNRYEFEQFVQENGKDILRFCRMTCPDQEAADELYQDTMVKLLEKRLLLNLQRNVKSYALSTAILLWKNKQKKDKNRKRLVPLESIDADEGAVDAAITAASVPSPESRMIEKDIHHTVRKLVAGLPEKYRMVLHLYYSANMPVGEIARVLHIPEGTVKSRMNKARHLLKKELEVSGYDG